MALAVALDIAAMCAGPHALLRLKRVLAALYVARSPLLHLLRVVARIVDVLMTEWALHGGLLLRRGYEANVKEWVGFRRCGDLTPGLLEEPRPLVPEGPGASMMLRFLPRCAKPG